MCLTMFRSGVLSFHAGHTLLALVSASSQPHCPLAIARAFVRQLIFQRSATRYVIISITPIINGRARHLAWGSGLKRGVRVCRGDLGDRTSSWAILKTIAMLYVC